MTTKYAHLGVGGTFSKLIFYWGGSDYQDSIPSVVSEVTFYCVKLLISSSYYYYVYLHILTNSITT